MTSELLNKLLRNSVLQVGYVRGDMITYQGYRADQWPWWCVHTPLHVIGSPIRPPVGHTEALSALLQSVEHLCPAHQGTWLCQMILNRCHIHRSIRKNVWGGHQYDLPSSGTGSISQGLIFSVSPLSQLRKKKECDNNNFVITVNLEVKMSLETASSCFWVIPFVTSLCS